MPEQLKVQLEAIDTVKDNTLKDTELLDAVVSGGKENELRKNLYTILKTGVEGSDELVEGLGELGVSALSQSFKTKPSDLNDLQLLTWSNNMNITQTQRQLLGLLSIVSLSTGGTGSFDESIALIENVKSGGLKSNDSLNLIDPSSTEGVDEADEVDEGVEVGAAADNEGEKIDDDEVVEVITEDDAVDEKATEGDEDKLVETDETDKEAGKDEASEDEADKTIEDKEDVEEEVGMSSNLLGIDAGVIGKALLDINTADGGSEWLELQNDLINKDLKDINTQDAGNNIIGNSRGALNAMFGTTYFDGFDASDDTDKQYNFLEDKSNIETVNTDRKDALVALQQTLIQLESHLGPIKGEEGLLVDGQQGLMDGLFNDSTLKDITTADVKNFEAGAIDEIWNTLGLDTSLQGLVYEEKTDVPHPTALEQSVGTSKSFDEGVKTFTNSNSFDEIQRSLQNIQENSILMKFDHIGSDRSKTGGEYVYVSKPKFLELTQQGGMLHEAGGSGGSRSSTEKDVYTVSNDSIIDEHLYESLVVSKDGNEPQGIDVSSLVGKVLNTKGLYLNPETEYGSKEIGDLGTESEQLKFINGIREGSEMDEQSKGDFVKKYNIAGSDRFKEDTMSIDQGISISRWLTNSDEPANVTITKYGVEFDKTTQGALSSGKNKNLKTNTSLTDLMKDKPNDQLPKNVQGYYSVDLNNDGSTRTLIHWKDLKKLHSGSSDISDQIRDLNYESGAESVNEQEKARDNFSRVLGMELNQIPVGITVSRQIDNNTFILNTGDTGVDGVSESLTEFKIDTSELKDAAGIPATGGSIYAQLSDLPVTLSDNTNNLRFPINVSPADISTQFIAIQKLNNSFYAEAKVGMSSERREEFKNNYENLGSDQIESKTES